MRVYWIPLCCIHGMCMHGHVQGSLGVACISSLNGYYVAMPHVTPHVMSAGTTCMSDAQMARKLKQWEGWAKEQPGLIELHTYYNASRYHEDTLLPSATCTTSQPCTEVSVVKPKLGMSCVVGTSCNENVVTMHMLLRNFDTLYLQGSAMAC
jgi:hypothetical protein